MKLCAFTDEGSCRVEDVLSGAAGHNWRQKCRDPRFPLRWLGLGSLLSSLHDGPGEPTTQTSLSHLLAQPVRWQLCKFSLLLWLWNWGYYFSVFLKKRESIDLTYALFSAENRGEHAALCSRQPGLLPILNPGRASFHHASHRHYSVYLW